MRRSHVVAVLALAAVLVAPGAALGLVSQPFEPAPGNVDLARDATALTIVGADAARQLGRQLDTGDVNGDGVEDIVAADTRAAFVVFGGQSGLIDTALLPAAAGFELLALNAGVSVVGDVNGDGRADVAVASLSDDVEIVFGATAAPVFPATSDGFAIEAETTFPDLEVDGAGDVNRDGLADVLVVDHAAASRRGRAYVVFGKVDRDPVRLGALGDGGYRIVARRVESIAAAGDVNGDGRGDGLVSDTGYSTGLVNVGRVSVVFGKGSTSDVDLDRLGSRGYEILGAAEGDGIGLQMLNAGDVDGDGTPDQAVLGYGGIWVVFGKRSTTPVTLTSNLRGFEIVPAAGFLSAQTLGAGGDTNGDGLADLLIGYPGAATDAAPNVGSVWVVFGRSSRSTVFLETNTNGYRIDGVDSGDETGAHPTFRRSAGGVNVLVDASGATFARSSPEERGSAGAVFEIDDSQPGFASADPPFADLSLQTDPARFLLGGAGAPTISFRALQPLRARAALWRLTPGTQTVRGRCVTTRQPKEGQRACVVRRKVRSAAVAVRAARDVSIPLTTSFRPGAYVATLSVTTQGGRTFGPYRRAFRVQP